MVLLKRFFNIYINSNVHVALAVFCLTYLTLTRLELGIDTTVLFFNFFGTILGYNFVKYAHIISQNNFKNTVNIKVVIVLSLISFFSLIYFTFQLQLKSVLLLVVSFLFTLFYSLSFSWFHPKLNFGLRNVPGLKVFLIAFVWSIVTVLFPVVELSVVWSIDILFSLIQLFLFVVVLMLPFEIRDLKYDSKQLNTLPQVLGVRITKILGTVLALMVFLLEFFKNDISQKQIIVSGLVLCVLAFLVNFSELKQSKYYASFWVEAIPMLWLLLLIIF